MNPAWDIAKRLMVCDGVALKGLGAGLFTSF